VPIENLFYSFTIHFVFVKKFLKYIQHKIIHLSILLTHCSADTSNSNIYSDVIQTTTHSLTLRKMATLHYTQKKINYGITKDHPKKKKQTNKQVTRKET
jgi:hypothetical protein